MNYIFVYLNIFVLFCYIGISLEANSGIVLPNINVASDDYQAKLIKGTPTPNANLFGNENPKVLNRGDGYVTGVDNETIIELNGEYLLNYFQIQLYDLDLRNYYYNIDISADNITWVNVIDRMQLSSRSWQYHDFPASIVKFIRIKGYNSINNMLHLIKFKAMFNDKRFNCINLK